MYTGNIIFHYFQLTRITVYPCVYREHCFAYSYIDDLCGLSLCIQGTYCYCLSLSATYRFIPVYTGNISSFMSVCGLIAVYPCVYREHPFFINIWINGVGLSLCIQGTYFFCARSWDPYRFIPVYTGNMY